MSSSWLLLATTHACCSSFLVQRPMLPLSVHNILFVTDEMSFHRVGVFFVTRMDGVVDIWDCLHGQNEATYSHKVLLHKYQQRQAD